MAALIFLAFFLVLDVLALLGYCADSRDSRYSMGKMLAPPRASDSDSR
jgi:hypothetical protein